MWLTGSPSFDLALVQGELGQVSWADARDLVKPVFELMDNGGTERLAAGLQQLRLRASSTARVYIESALPAAFAHPTLSNTQV